jgi:hypothetical protein
MKRRLCYLLFIAVLIFNGCSNDIPDPRTKAAEIIPSKPCPTLYQNILDQFPEYTNNEANWALLFDENAEKQIRLFKESEVYVTYISEGAGYSNSFGWYSYPSSQPPSDASSLKLNIVFPNVNKKVLKEGDMVQLSTEKFPAGTVVGFFLILRGWENGSVNESKPKMYTDFKLNPNGQQQHILYKEKDCGDIVLGFEDKQIGVDSDNDFNDVLFTISDNKENLDVTSFDLRKMIRM